MVMMMEEEEDEGDDVSKKMMDGKERYEDTWMRLHASWLCTKHPFAREKSE